MNYISYFFLAFVTTALYFLLQTQSVLSRLTALIILITGYVVWGIYQYYLEYRTVPTKILIEYFLYGLLGLALVIGLIYY